MTTKMRALLVLVDVFASQMKDPRLDLPSRNHYGDGFVRLARLLPISLEGGVEFDFAILDGEVVRISDRDHSFKKMRPFAELANFTDVFRLGPMYRIPPSFRAMLDMYRPWVNAFFAKEAIEKDPLLKVFASDNDSNEAIRHESSPWRLIRIWVDRPDRH